MRGVRQGFLVAVVVLVLGLASSAWADEDSSSSVAEKSSVSEPSRVEKEKFLFGQFSTTTYTVVSASTSTVFFSCNSGTHTSVCQGRRKRKSLGLTRELPLSDEESMDLQGSLEEDDNAEAEVKNDPAPGEGELDKFAFTVWTTSRTTTSITVFYTNTSSTVRVSFYCIAGQLAAPTFPCAG